jgi:tetratricopeptide (TPR) repeat protein
MKNSGKLLLALLLVLSVLTTSVPCNAQTPAQAAEAQAAEAMAAQERWVAIVTSAQGGVYVQHPGQTQWEPLKVADKCYPGDSIRVEENSRAALLFKNDSTLRIDQNTSLTFQPMEEQTVIMRLFNGAACFFSRFPRSLKIFTPHMNGTVKGTEFVIRVDGDQTQLTLYEGQVLAENEKGELMLAGGQSVVAKKDQAPALVTVVRPRDAVQWALYYPSIQDFAPGDFPGEADWQVKSRTSVEAWRKGDLAGAVGTMKGLRDEAVTDTRYLLYRASLALTVGRADEASAYLERTLKADPKNANAYALQSVIATTQNNKTAAMDLATKAVSLDPQSSAARIALSYAQQARFDITGAMASVQEAVKLNASDAYARARLAELWLAQGYLNKAMEAAEGAVRINPSLARTQTVLGFAYLTQVKIADAMAAFEKAIALDSADPLPRLGLGLAKIRKGNLAAGRQEIEIAASLDLNSALIRSYLGKAYYEEKRESLSANQFAAAKQLDPMDPTPWFYDAILKQSVNRPVEAMQDIQKSIELNNNRAVYRSQLLLDQDLAARSAGLGQIFNNLGFQQLALVEGWKSVNTDPANFSAHRFLADSYASRPRHEVARVSELLQSQLLQPININPVQPLLGEANLRMFAGSGPTSLSFNEFNPLFNRNSVQLQASGAAGNKDTIGDEVALSGIYDRLSVSLGQVYYKSDGFRDNNDQHRELYNAFAQWMITPQTSIQMEGRYSYFKYGDLALRFDPSEYYSDRFYETMRTARFGLRHSFSPNSDMIASVIYSKANLNVKAFEGIYEGEESPNQAWMSEVQHLYRTGNFHLITGAGYANGDSDVRTVWTFPGFDPAEERFHEDTHHTNFYAYTLTTFPRSMTWTLGVSADFFGATNYDGRDQVNPKIGLTWTPWDSTTLRAAAFRTLKRTMITRQTIEPTQVAGFNQFFDDFNGTDAWNYGVAVDQKISKTLFAGAEFTWRDLTIPYYDSIIGYTTTDEKQEMARGYLYWAPLAWFAASAEYEYERWERPPIFTGEEDFTKAKTHRIPLAVNVFLPSGLFGQFKGTYVNQEVDAYDTAVFDYVPANDNFWVFDAAIGYRLPKRYGLITFEVKNLFNESFRFVETDRYMPRIVPDRFMIGRITLSF